jgi:hypothetical protein
MKKIYRRDAEDAENEIQKNFSLFFPLRSLRLCGANQW